MRGWEGLYGRPRPVPLASTLGEHDHPHPAVARPPARLSPLRTSALASQVDVYWATLAVALEKKSGTGYARDPLHPFGIMAFKGLLLLQVQVEEVDHSSEIRGTIWEDRL